MRILPMNSYQNKNNQPNFQRQLKIRMGNKEEVFDGSQALEVWRDVDAKGFLVGLVPKYARSIREAVCTIRTEDAEANRYAHEKLTNAWKLAQTTEGKPILFFHGTVTFGN